MQTYIISQRTMKYGTFSWRIEGPKIQFIRHFTESISFYLSRPYISQSWAIEYWHQKRRFDIIVLKNGPKSLEIRFIDVWIRSWGQNSHWSLALALTVAESCRLEIQCSISRTKRPRSNLAGAFNTVFVKVLGC